MRYGTFSTSGRRLAALAVVFFLMVSSPIGQAGELHFILNGKAIHLEDPGPGQHFNESNWGAGLQYDLDASDDGNWIPFATFAGFNDSNQNPSYYVGGGTLRRFRPSGSSFHVDLGVAGFFMVREDYRNNRPFPGVLPVLSLGTDAVSLNVTYVPDIDPKSVPLVFFQLKLRLMAL